MFLIKRKQNYTGKKLFPSCTRPGEGGYPSRPHLGLQKESPTARGHCLHCPPLCGRTPSWTKTISRPHLGFHPPRLLPRGRRQVPAVQAYPSGSASVR